MLPYHGLGDPVGGGRRRGGAYLQSGNAHHVGVEGLRVLRAERLREVRSDQVRSGRSGQQSRVTWLGAVPPAPMMVSGIRNCPPVVA